MSKEMSCFDVKRNILSLHSFVASFKKISSKSDFIQNFNDLICIYSPMAGVDKVLMSTETSCHDPSSSSSSDILFTMLLFHTKRQSRRREIIQSNIYRTLPTVNQVIYTSDTFCMPNIMTSSSGSPGILFTRFFMG